jgi:hypothetical protein
MMYRKPDFLKTPVKFQKTLKFLTNLLEYQIYSV